MFHIPDGTMPACAIEILILDIEYELLVGDALATLALLQTLVQVLLESSIPPGPCVLIAVVRPYHHETKIIITCFSIYLHHSVDVGLERVGT